MACGFEIASGIPAIPALPKGRKTRLEPGEGGIFSNFTQTLLRYEISLELALLIYYTNRVYIKGQVPAVLERGGMCTHRI
jgi:hypothetical protein